MGHWGNIYYNFTSAPLLPDHPHPPHLPQSPNPHSLNDN
ncbi:hypothetical protein COO91_06738 [Nostoc flagelliforme CCNUN1]|uniref:Uncharacterized protein n=1 Tax=Nostoc flagelliforme CCNUN1 TaxID=2038116 RepID=A0A2K8T129_9NOSO|nr:hypothetical protein COO91_06738 [Nostoc flagelliforme CCNUN1]